MKPKKQIDFLVEEFFNTGKLNLTKEEEGITFDQLEILTEQDDTDIEISYHDTLSKVKEGLDIGVPVLMKGSKCGTEENCWVEEYIILIKSALSILYPDIINEINGTFGSRTEKAVKKFQTENGITPVDGKVGPQTFNALFTPDATQKRLGSHLTDTLGKETTPVQALRKGSAVILKNMVNNTELRTLSEWLKPQLIYYNINEHIKDINELSEKYQATLRYFLYKWMETKPLGANPANIIKNIRDEQLQHRMTTYGNKIYPHTSRPNSEPAIENLIRDLNDVENITIPDLIDEEFLTYNRLNEKRKTQLYFEDILKNYILDGATATIEEIISRTKLGVAGKKGVDYSTYKVRIDEIQGDKEIDGIPIGNDIENEARQDPPIVTDKNLNLETTTQGKRHYTNLSNVIKKALPTLNSLKINFIWDTFNRLIATLEKNEQEWYKNAGDINKSYKGTKSGFMESFKSMLIHFITKNGEENFGEIIGDLNQIITYIKNEDYVWEDLKKKLLKLINNKDNYKRIIDVFEDKSKEADDYEKAFYDTEKNPNTPFDGKSTSQGITHWVDRQQGQQSSSMTFKELLTNIDISAKELIEGEEEEGQSDETTFFDRNAAAIEGLLESYKVPIQNLIERIITEINNADNPYEKADLYLNSDLVDENHNVIISAGNIEVKKFKPQYNTRDDGLKRLDSFMSEFFAYGKNKRDNPFYNALNTKLKTIVNTVYNYIIQQVYLGISDNTTIFNNLRAGTNPTTGFVFDEHYITPMDNVVLYWSNKGQRQCNELRLSIRFYIIEANRVYNLKYDPTDGEYNYTNVSTSEIADFTIPPSQTICGATDNPVIGMDYEDLIIYLITDTRGSTEINESIEEYISTLLGF